MCRAFLASYASAQPLIDDHGAWSASEPSRLELRAPGQGNPVRVSIEASLDPDCIVLEIPDKGEVRIFTEAHGSLVTVRAL